MNLREKLTDFLPCYEGELLTEEDASLSITINYKAGVLPFFSRLELLVLDKSRLNPAELEKAITAYNFPLYFPLPHLVALSKIADKEIEKIIERIQEDLRNELYSYSSPSGDSLIVANGRNLSRRGLFYYPAVEPGKELPEPMPLLEITESGIKLYKENLARLAE